MQLRSGRQRFPVPARLAIGSLTTTGESGVVIFARVNRMRMGLLAVGSVATPFFWSLFAAVVFRRPSGHLRSPSADAKPRSRRKGRACRGRRLPRLAVLWETFDGIPTGFVVLGW